MRRLHSLMIRNWLIIMVRATCIAGPGLSMCSAILHTAGPGLRMCSAILHTHECGEDGNFESRWELLLLFNPGPVQLVLIESGTCLLPSPQGLWLCWLPVVDWPTTQVAIRRVSVCRINLSLTELDFAEWYSHQTPIILWLTRLFGQAVAVMDGQP